MLSLRRRYPICSSTRMGRKKYKDSPTASRLDWGLLRRLAHEVSVFDDLSGDPPPYMAKRNTIADPDFNGWFSGRRLQQSLQSALDARQGKA